MSRYEIPTHWTKLDFAAIAPSWVDAQASVRTLKALPFQRDWVKNFQEAALRREVAGTSRIEGADFTERELDEALKEDPVSLITRSQRQAHAAAQTYRWIATIPDDRPVDSELILEIHRRMVTGADDDHCPPGKLRGEGENVNFGAPSHRGAEGGAECRRALDGLVSAIRGEFQGLDPILRGLAAHYHLAAMHPFMDGNGRTARALEALFLQRAGMRDICFISISNYYYDEKPAYLVALNQARETGHDLTPFLKFSLQGVALQGKRLCTEITQHLAKAVYRNLIHELYERLRSPRKRVVGDRQIRILNLLLKEDKVMADDLFEKLANDVAYQRLKNWEGAAVRDLKGLKALGAIALTSVQDRERENLEIRLRLEWPEEITGEDFEKRFKTLPNARSAPILASGMDNPNPPVEDT